MRTITVIERVSLDGVMQAPGSPDEDKRGGFTLGGWGTAYNDDVIGEEMGKGMGKTELLLDWQNSDLLDGDAATSVAKLKRTPGKDLSIIGSGVLVGSLLKAGLVDKLMLLIHPLVLGAGRKLFEDDVDLDDLKLRLAGSVTSPSGVVIATYLPA